MAGCPDSRVRPRARDRGVDLSGDVPDPADQPDGCSFHPRCHRVVPPEALDIDERTVRAVLDFRLALRDGDVAPEDFADASAVRSEFGLGRALSDPKAEGVLSEAALAVAAGDVETATTRLDGTFTSVCEREDPEFESTIAGHPAACLRVGNPIEAGETGPD